VNPAIFVRAIKTFLAQANITGPELAATLELPESTLRGWLTGQRTPSQESILDFCTRMRAFQTFINAASAALDNFLLPE